MAGFRRVRRRGRGIPVVVVLFVALAFGITSSSADTAGIADTATAPIAADVSAGLQSFAQALTGLDGLNQLGQSLPFTSQTPAATNGLDFAHSFVDSLKTNLASHVPFNSLLELQTYLSTGIDSTYGGVTVHATGAIAPVGSLYTIDLTLDLSRTGTTPLALDTPQTNVDGGSLATTFHTTANLTFKYDPAQADGNKFYLDEALNPLLTTTVGAAADFTATPFDVNLGFTKVHVGGTAGVGATITAQLQDPDGNGKVTQTEWSTTAPQSEFDVAFTASHANANVSLSSDILTPTSGSLANATITEADSNLANGLDAPSVSLGDLGDFKNIQPQEFLSGLASFAIMVQSLESSGPAGTAIPFLQHDPHALPTTDNGRPVEHIADFLKLNQSLIDFFTANGLNNPAPADPLSLNLDPAHLASVATIQQVTAQLETSLGMSAGALGIAYDPTTHKLTFNLGQTKTLSPITGRVDVADQLQNIGITGVQAAAQATITPSYDWSAKLGLDLSSATTPLPDRFFVVPSATHFSADFPVTGALDLAGQIGFLGVSLKSAHAGVEGPVDLLAARNTAHPMLNLQLKNNAHPSVDQLSFSDIFNAFGSSSALANPLNVLDATDASDVFNVTVPTFDLNAKATLGDSAPSLLQGKVTVAWDKVTDPGTLSLTADGTFNDQLLNFDFDSSNPAAMFTTIMNVLGPFADQLSQLVASNPNLQAKLPVINRSFAELVNEFDLLKQQVQDFATSPASFLQLFEMDLQNRIAGILETVSGTTLSPADRQALVNITAPPPASPGDPQTVLFHLSFGVCGQATGSTLPAGCTVHYPLNVPLNVDLPSLGGIVGVSGTGNIGIDASAIVNLTFGIQLPNVDTTPGMLPSASGAPSLFIDTAPADTSLHLDVSAQTADNTTLEANIGPLKVKIGKASAPEAGAQCANATDDDGDGVVNDGCPAVGPPEDATTGQCTNATDDDSTPDGKINDGCPATGAPIEARIGAKFHLEHDTGGDHRLVIDPSNLTNLTSWLGDTVPTSLDDFRPTTQVSCSGMPGSFGSGPWDACASLPVFVGSSPTAPPDGYISFAAPNLFAPGGWQSNVDAGIVSAIEAQALDFTTWINGLNELSAHLSAMLDTSSYQNANIPVIGNSLSAGAEIAKSFHDNVTQPLADVANALHGIDPSAVQTQIQDALSTPLLAAHLLQPYDSGSVAAATASDIHVNVLCGSDEHLCLSTEHAIDITDVSVGVAIGQSSHDQSLNFSGGLPGLRLTMDDPLTSKVGWRLDLNFGLSKTRGFYLRTDDPMPGRATTGELTVSADLHLPQHVEGDIAFLRLKIANNHSTATPDMHLGLSADIKGGQTDAADGGAVKLDYQSFTASDPQNPADVAVKLDANVNLDLHLTTTIHLPDSLNIPSNDGSGPQLPELSTDFLLTWDFGTGFSLNGGVDASSGTTPLAIQFNNVSLDLGQFFGSFLGPIVKEVQRFTKPLQPVLDTVNAPIPGISDLSELAGAGKVTMIDFFEHASGADLTLVKRLIKLIDLINALPTSGSSIVLGSFSVSGSGAEGPTPTGDNADSLIASKSPAFSDSTSVLAQAASDGHITNGGALADSSSGDGGLTFPAFEHPTTLFSLLVGKDVKLIEFDAGNLSASFSFDITIGPFPVGPVPVSIIIGGSAGVSGHFAIGYSTRGIRQAVKNLTDPAADHSVFSLGSLLFDGVFIDDLNADGVDVPEIELTAEVHAGAEVDIVIASAGVEAGIRATVDLNLHDGGRPTVQSQVDGLLYIDEIAKMLNNPICLFDVSGELDAFVKFFVTIGISPFDVSFDVTLIDVTLMKMTDITGPICDNPPPPHLAEMHGSTMVLKMGERYTPGRNINDGTTGDLVTDEKFVVRQLDSGAGPAHSFSVTAFGLTQTYDGVERIFADGGVGNDSIMMQPGATPSASPPTPSTPAGTITTQTFDVTVPTELCGGPGNDNIQGGRGADTIAGDSGESSPGSLLCAVNTTNTGGGDGSDKIDGSSGNDTLYGNGGVDAINAGDGNDVVYGGDGTDSVQGGPGADELHGGADADNVSGGPEVDPASSANVSNCAASLPSCVNLAQTSDTIYGDGGNDSLTGDGGNDTVYGGDGNDTISGGSGNDTLNGEAGDDTITGGTGNDTANGGDGADQIFGEVGSDTLNGGDGPDVLVGSDDNTASTGVGDTINGDGGNDLIFGDQATPASGSFVETGNFVGNDTINGGDGNDIVWGQDGADTINGGNGADELHGENGADTMNGDAGVDTMFGDAGTDTMHGGDDGDIMRGGTEHDVMFGDAGDDTMFGDAGNDTMNGGDGVDHMRGGTENDLMHGDAGDDVMNGDAGTDTMYGDVGNDSMHGDADDDYMEGNAGSDTMTGDAGQDDIVGGSNTAGQPDAGDTICGGDCITPALPSDHDVIAGDNALITRPGGDRVDGAHIRNVTLYDLASTDLSLYGDDTISGDQGNDRIFGQNGNDTLHGNDGDDSIEGNQGNDAVFGDAGQDDLIGGTSQGGGGVPDGNDCIQGDNRDNGCNGSGSGGGAAVGGTGGGAAGADVMIGDNGSITRSVDGSDWLRHSFGMGADDIVVRTVTQYDLQSTDLSVPAPAAGTSGNDYLFGDAERDIQYGQGGNDVIHGGNGDDYAEGNAGADFIYGEAGNDDLVGGSLEAQRLDTGDTIDGGAGYDVIAGDNAVLQRVLDPAGLWLHNTYDLGIQHVARVLNDIDSPDTLVVSGGDTITGGSENDLIYGQGGSDTIQGNAGDDFIEGNAAGDIINGNEGQDDIIGGTVQAAVSDGADTIHGDQGEDVVAGDNATITRPLDGLNHWILDNRSHSSSAIVRRAVQLYDVATVASSPAATTSDGDTITGDDGADQLFGQGGSDTISGGADDDYVEGNAGSDTITGNTGRDDLIGGGSANDGVISATSIGNTLIDANDNIHGNESGDAIAGDNARITRLPLAPVATAATLWQTDPNTDADSATDKDPIRIVQQFDLDKVGAAAPDASTSGGDALAGDDGRDIMVGQGANDTMSGGEGVDYMTGNAGADTMTGDGGEDDMIGGSSSGDGRVSDVLPVSLRGSASSPRDLRDSGDNMSGNLEDDAMVGDNASIARPERTGSVAGSWWRLTNANFDLARRIVTMEKTPEAVGAYGDDTMAGNDGNDDMYGQLGNDTMTGNMDEDAMVGDLGQITNNLIDGGADGLADPGAQQLIAPSAPFFDPGEKIFATGSLYRQVELYSFDSSLPNVGSGNDTMSGGEGHDSMHGGPGADVMSGNAGDDYMFADDSTLVTFPLATYSPVGADAMWGGPGHDTMYGGHGIDYIDVLPRPSFVDKKGTFPRDPQAWFDAAATDPVQTDGHAGAYSGLDIMYGGWDQDWMQLDVSAPGPPPGDRALDWNGGFNAYYRCDPAYGDWGITRQHSPSMQVFLQQLAFGMGAVQTSTPGTSGFNETAMVFPGEQGNANPVNPDNPAHFTCGVPHS